MPKGRSGRRHTLRTRRGTTYIGGGKRTYRSKAGGIVSKKGAYRPAQKKNFMRKRAAVVETKRKTDEELRATGFFAGTGDPTVPFDDRLQFHVRAEELHHLNPRTYFWWSQGLDQSQHIGQCVTVKHLNQKVQVRFPQPHMEAPAGTPQQIPHIPQNYQLYWGWIPAPRQLTGRTSPPVNTETVASLDSYVNNRVKDYFNDRKDRLRFIPKKDSTLIISGKKNVRPDLRYQSSRPPQSMDLDDEINEGSLPDWYGEISWKMPNGGKKLWLEQSGNMTGGNDLIGMFPNYAYLPWCALVDWNFSEKKEALGSNVIRQCPSVAANSIVYFTDS